jgi:hypothetical protein
MEKILQKYSNSENYVNSSNYTDKEYFNFYYKLKDKKMIYTMR